MFSKDIYRMNILEKYKKAGLTPFTFNISVDKKTGIKIFDNFTTRHTLIKKYNDKYIDRRKNGYGIRMGVEHSGKYIIGFDVDNKIEDGIYDGLPKWIEILKEHYDVDETKNIDIDETYKQEFEKLKHDNILLHLKTPTQLTGNNGYHYIFFVTEEQLKVIGGGLTGLYINNSEKKFKIDIKAINGYLACEPSTYKNKKYKWLKAPHDVDIMDMPDWLFEIVSKGRQEPVIIKKKIKAVTELQVKTILKEYDNSSEIQKYFECLDVSRYDDYNDWILLGRIIKANNIPFEYYLEMSKTSKKYKVDEPASRWASFGQVSNLDRLNLSLYYRAKQDNLIMYNSITSQILSRRNIQQLFDIENYKQLKINKKYLLDATIEDKIIMDNIHTWQTTDIKTFNIKSKYGSGKTQLQKKIIEKYDVKRILYITHRQTLTDNISDEFNKLGFKSYLDGIYRADKQIIQLESIPKLFKDVYLDEDSIPHPVVPKYDLIIMDEIESILNHFSSKTFKDGSSETVYNKLFDIISNSTKLITLDGDLNKRALSYASNFGKMITINNKYNVSERKFNLMANEDDFKDRILKDADKAVLEKKFIAICSMSKTETEKYKNILMEHNPSIRILIINSESSDTDKKKLKNIQKEILNYDVFIYSPSVEAGVNIDIPGLCNKLYCIVCGGSSSPRSFLQMTARIRHLNDNNIDILNNKLFYYNCNNFYEYNEVYDSLNTNDNLRMRRTTEIKNGIMFEKIKITPYCETYIYNRLEKLNNNPIYFLRLLELYCEEKGIENNIASSNSDKKIKIVNDKETYFNTILTADKIDDDEKAILDKKVNIRDASVNDKIILIKKLYLKVLGVDKLNLSILEEYFKKLNPIDNFIKLVDPSKIRTNTIINETINKVFMVKEIIKELGFNGPCDDRPIKDTEFKAKLDAMRNKKEYFSKDTRILFSMAKFKTDIKTDKAIMGHINTILHNYGISIKQYQKREQDKETLTSFYKLVRLGSLDEILFYKHKREHFKYDMTEMKIDKSKFNYQELINSKKCKVELNPEDTQELIMKINLLELDLFDY